MALTFNHAMVYSRDVEASLAFYAGQLGFEILEEFRGGPELVYARLNHRLATPRLPCTSPIRKAS